MLWRFIIDYNYFATYEEFELWNERVGELIDIGWYPLEVQDMVRQYDRNSRGRTETTKKEKADIFMDWICNAVKGITAPVKCKVEK